jgi:hypothetical protein
MGPLSVPLCNPPQFHAWFGASAEAEKLRNLRSFTFSFCFLLFTATSCFAPVTAANKKQTLEGETRKVNLSTFLLLCTSCFVYRGPGEGKVATRFFLSQLFK